jgi:Cu/Ag efflux protein CusF
MTRRTLICTLAFFGAACSKKTASSSAYEYGAAKERYQLHGKVLRLRPEHRIAVIQHERIAGWMEAMTMEFPVPDAAEYAKLKEGATIRATVNVNDAFFWLTAIIVEQEPARP